MSKRKISEKEIQKEASPQMGISPVQKMLLEGVGLLMEAFGQRLKAPAQNQSQIDQIVDWIKSHHQALEDLDKILPPPESVSNQAKNDSSKPPVSKLSQSSGQGSISSQNPSQSEEVDSTAADCPCHMFKKSRLVGIQSIDAYCDVHERWT